MAEYNGSTAGTVGFAKWMMKPMSLQKWPSIKIFAGLGIAEAISYASFKKAKSLGAKQVILYSNTKNAGAIKLYEKLDFGIGGGTRLL